MSLQYDKPEDDNEVDKIFPSENINDVNDVTRSRNISLQYDKPDDDNEVDNILPTIKKIDEADDDNKLDYVVPSENTNDINYLTKEPEM